MGTKIEVPGSVEILLPETLRKPTMREIWLAVKCEDCGRWFNATSQEEMNGKCPNCGGEFYLFKRAAALDDQD